MERMFKHGMSKGDKCQRCGEKETYKQLIWECVEARRIWKGCNDYTCKIGYSQPEIKKFDEIFLTCDFGADTETKSFC